MHYADVVFLINDIFYIGWCVLYTCSTVYFVFFTWAKAVIPRLNHNARIAGIATKNSDY
jgi:hypothetical protein